MSLVIMSVIMNVSFFAFDVFLTRGVSWKVYYSDFLEFEVWAEEINFSSDSEAQKVNFSPEWAHEDNFSSGCGTKRLIFHQTLGPRGVFLIRLRAQEVSI